VFSRSLPACCNKIEIYFFIARLHRSSSLWRRRHIYNFPPRVCLQQGETVTRIHSLGTLLGRDVHPPTIKPTPPTSSYLFILPRFISHYVLPVVNISLLRARWSNCSCERASVRCEACTLNNASAFDGKAFFYLWISPQTQWVYERAINVISFCVLEAVNLWPRVRGQKFYFAIRCTDLTHSYSMLLILACLLIY
jgi:hypothetical protein